MSEFLTAAEFVARQDAILSGRSNPYFGADGSRGGNLDHDESMLGENTIEVADDNYAELLSELAIAYPGASAEFLNTLVEKVAPNDIRQLESGELPEAPVSPVCGLGETALVSDRKLKITAASIDLPLAREFSR